MGMGRAIRWAGRGAMQALMRAAVARPGLRALVNRWYLRLGWEGRVRFRRRFAQIFHEDGRRIAPGLREVEFAGRRIRLPLGARTAWLDWDLAVSILANDPEIKRFYARHAEVCVANGVGGRLEADGRPEPALAVGHNFSACPTEAA